MKRAVIICNGNLANINNVTFLKSDFIICADGGVEKLLKMNIVPSVVIGDFDSTQQKTILKLKKENIQLIEYPRKKDKTDSELALDYVIEKKYREIIICGLLGSRIDHVLSNILMLGKFIHKGHNITVIEDKTTMYTVRKEITILGKKNNLVSLLPITKNVEVVLTEGLQYSLKNETLDSGSSRGVSNIMQAKIARVAIKKGILLVSHTSD